MLVPVWLRALLEVVVGGVDDAVAHNGDHRRVRSARAALPGSDVPRIPPLDRVRGSAGDVGVLAREQERQPARDGLGDRDVPVAGNRNRRLLRPLPDDAAAGLVARRGGATRAPRKPQPLPEPLPPERRSVGQLIAETISFYQRHFFQSLPLGISVAALTQLTFPFGRHHTEP